MSPWLNNVNKCARAHVQLGACTHGKGARQRVQRGWTERAGRNHV